MIGFVKWLISEYKCYKLGQIFKTTQEEKDRLFTQNYNRCIEVGFTNEQVLALMNLLYSKGD